MFLKREAYMIICLVMCFAFLAPGSSFAVEETPVERAQYSIVRVICLAEETNDGYYLSSGTGFAVGESRENAQIFVTNYHVVADNTQEVYVTITNLENTLPAMVIYQDAEHDIAILKTGSPVFGRYPIQLLSPTELNKSQDVYCLGFPGLMDEYSDGENFSSTINDITITKGSVSNPTYSSGGISTILSDVKINHGNSGGPMVDEYGRAVGINTAMLGDGSGQNMSLAVSVDYLMDILNYLNISYDAGDGHGQDDETSGGKLSTIAIFFILPGMFAAVIFGAIYLLRGKKDARVRELERKKTSEDEQIGDPSRLKINF